MTINEFRAWLDGFKEAMGDAPTPEQWAKVLEKVAIVREVSALPYLSPTYPSTLPGTVPNYPGTLRFGEITCRNDMAFTSTTPITTN